MTLRHRFSLRTVAAGSALGLVAGAAAVLGGVAPASAAATLNMNCTVPVVGAKTFGVQMDTNAPASVVTGATTKPKLTALMTVPADLADLMRNALSVDSIYGTIVAQMSVNGAAQPVTLTIPSTPAGAVGSGDLQLTGTGAFAPIKTGAPGSIKLTAGDQAVTMNLVDSDNPDNPSPFEIPCTPTDGQNLTVDTVKVTKATSKTRASVAYKARTDKATGKATVSGSNGVAATGKVRFTLNRGAKKIGTKTVSLKSGKASAIFSKVRKTGKYKLTAKYLGSTRVNGSSGSATFRVR